MIDILQYIITGILIAITTIYLWTKLSKRKIDFKKSKTYVIFIILGFLMFLNYYHMNGYIRVATILLVYMILYHILYKSPFKESVIISMITQLVYIISELIYAIGIYFIFGGLTQGETSQFLGTIISNVIVILIAIVIIQIPLFRNLYKLVIDKTKKISSKAIILLMVFTIVTFNILVGILFYSNNLFNTLIINILLGLIYFAIIIMVLDSKDKYIKVSDKYNLAKASLDGLQQAINSLRVNNHENKNQLSVIRTMILKGDKGVSKYIDALMEDRIAQDEALMKETDNISNSAIGSILYSKMLHMKGQNIDAYLHVDKKIKVTDLIDLDENTVVDICKIIGVFLDNAIQAVSNLERKIVKVDIVMDEYQKINITIMNNYNGIIEPSKIGKMGYSTKGHGHGYGLSLVKNIVESNKELSTERSIYNDIFTQTLVINIKKNKKTSMQDT